MPLTHKKRAEKCYSKGCFYDKTTDFCVTSMPFAMCRRACYFARRACLRKKYATFANGCHTVYMMEDRDIRSRLLLGDDAMRLLGEARVIIFGIGGVGSWCAESLVRTGIRHLTIVDCDRVSPSNINRQLTATVSTVGLPKVDVLRQRLLDIRPDAEIDARFERFGPLTVNDTVTAKHLSEQGLPNSETVAELETFDCIIDAIDSLVDKMLLIRTACETETFFVSSMGAALKTDPSRIQVAPFDKVHGCPLAKALRRRFKHEGLWPSRPFPCVFSDEQGSNKFEIEPHANGSLMHVTATFGLRLAALVIQDIILQSSP